MKKLKWTRRIHPTWREVERVKINVDPTLDNLMPKHQYKDEEERFSIISPSDISFSEWELFDHESNEVYRFPTLKEAKEFAENLFNPKPHEKNLNKKSRR